MMDDGFTLPRLQLLLDELPDGRRLAVARKQLEGLFGVNDAGTARLLRFASGHHCIIAHADSSVVFEKRPPP